VSGQLAEPLQDEEIMAETPLTETDLPGLPVRRGKVRDIYDLGDHLVMVATDRISAFDVVLPTGISDKGRILTSLTLFWHEFLKARSMQFGSDVLETDPAKMGEPFASKVPALRGRTLLVRKTQVIPFECVVRGYLAGSGWKEYEASGTVCGEKLPAGLVQAAKLPEPIFTPATKVEKGHDENVPFARMVESIGELAHTVRKLSVGIYTQAAEYAASRGIILADTKFEWGTLGGNLYLIDEVLTPDSSRFWPADQWEPGKNPPSFDKQYLRDWLAGNWDKKGTPPPLPIEVAQQTRRRYHEAHERLTGRKLDG
jgi:phosphoribosylaminoimidazole-succinocarboxamide synthase